MNIGVFDSGLGGLIILKSIINKLPEYDYLYLGDTKRLPYGERDQEEIYQFTRDGVDYLFRHNCELIIIACNTASSEALAKIQQEYLPENYPERRVLGVIVPTLETLMQKPAIKKVGVIATPSTVKSGAYLKEIQKNNQSVQVFQQKTPLLVPLIEEMDFYKQSDLASVLHNYLKPLLLQKIDSLILGCTHYCLIKETVRKLVGNKIQVISQDELIANKLKNYLAIKPEIEAKLTRSYGRVYNITRKSNQFEKKAKVWFGEKIDLKLVRL